MIERVKKWERKKYNKEKEQSFTVETCRTIDLVQTKGWRDSR